MKKLILLILVAIIPILTIAQKRNKKGSSDKNTTKVSNSNFMIIKGVELDMSHEGMGQDEIDAQSSDVSLGNLMKKHVKPMSRFYFSYDVGGHSDEVQELMAVSEEFRSMAQAVNKAAEYGWEFINATILIDGAVKIHYYHMKK